MQLFDVELSGSPQQVTGPTNGPGELPHGVIGLDIARRVVKGEPQIVVQLLLDDEAAGFDRTLLDAPIIAELTEHVELADRGTNAGARTVAREPFDHDAFRRRLRDELAAGKQFTRGVLVLDRGELLPPWIRLAFIPIELSDAAGGRLIVQRTTRDELVAGVDHAYSAGELTDDERTAMLMSIEQRHPG